MQNSSVQYYGIVGGCQSVAKVFCGVFSKLLKGVLGSWQVVQIKRAHPQVSMTFSSIVGVLLQCNYGIFFGVFLSSTDSTPSPMSPRA